MASPCCIGDKQCDKLSSVVASPLNATQTLHALGTSCKVKNPVEGTWALTLPFQGLGPSHCQFRAKGPHTAVSGPRALTLLFQGPGPSQCHFRVQPRALTLLIPGPRALTLPLQGPRTLSYCSDVADWLEQQLFKSPASSFCTGSVWFPGQQAVWTAQRLCGFLHHWCVIWSDSGTGVDPDPGIWPVHDHETSPPWTGMMIPRGRR